MKNILILPLFCLLSPFTWARTCESYVELRLSNPHYHDHYLIETCREQKLGKTSFVIKTVLNGKMRFAPIGEFRLKQMDAIFSDFVRMARQEPRRPCRTFARFEIHQGGEAETALFCRQSKHFLFAEFLQVFSAFHRLESGGTFADTLRSAGLGPEMVEIPAGRFRMGCVSGRDCDEDEKPVHEVTIASFALSKYEVTFEEYDRFTDATGHERAGDEGWGRGRRPVSNVSREDVLAYAEWLSSETGEGYRLPSEAEWEYAARAGSTTKYHFGDDESRLCRYANHSDTSTDYEWRNTACSDGVGKRTATVGTYQPNAFGLYDMHGNVWEWVQDCWEDSYRDAPSDGTPRAPWDGSDCEHQVLRGGSWGDGPNILRAADRVGTPRGMGAGSSGGFRVARTLAP